MGILLGFEIGTGRRVEVPENGHLAWFGQTQLSGKTTALEALVFRGHFKAVAFITKRGEGSFLTGRQVAPYFSEPTNDPEQPLWRWVQSILEASQQRKMRFEESWIINACEEPRRAKSLADVQKNIADLLAGEFGMVTKGRGKRAKQVRKTIRKPVAGINAGVYTSLKAYFDIVMPQLARLPYSKKLDLRPGLNVMDLRSYSMETQALVIRSVMEYVYLHESNVRVIVPEAQDFIPQGRNSPVKMACETLVRKGAADRNFMWLDSQDMAAVEKVMLRAVSILGCGVQGEAHEMNRAIAHLFGATLRANDIGRLKIGEFFVRVAGGDVTKVYVQPAWMDSELHAQAIARGEESVASSKKILARFKDRQEASAPPPADVIADPLPGEVVKTSQADECQGDEAMWKEKYLDLEVEFETLKDAHDKLAERLNRLLNGEAAIPYASNDSRSQGVVNDGKADRSAEALAKAESPADTGKLPHGANGAARANDGLGAAPESFDTMYCYIRERAMREPDPAVLSLLVERPELVVTVERKKITADSRNLPGQMALLVAEGYFTEPRQNREVIAEAVRRGWLGVKTPHNLLDKKQALGGLVEAGFLTKEPSGYQAVPGMKVSIVEAN